jgi:hypothetical protein
MDSQLSLSGGNVYGHRQTGLWVFTLTPAVTKGWPLVLHMVECAFPWLEFLKFSLSLVPCEVTSFSTARPGP